MVNELKSADWLQELAHLDATSEAALCSFLAKTILGDVEPIPLGTHKGVSYFIETGSVGIPQRANISLTPLDRMRGVSDYIKSYEFELLPDGGGPRPDFRYGFGLGYLVYKANGNSYPEYAGFFTVYNIVDKSIWIVVDMEPFENASTAFRIDPLPSTWGLLPGDNDKQIGIMRISQSECKCYYEVCISLHVVDFDTLRVEEESSNFGEWGSL